MRLVVENLRVRYKGSGSPALRGVSFTADSGLLLVAGGSGSGKTTLARTIAGVIPEHIPAEVKGRVEVLGVPMPQGREELAGRVALLSQVAEECAFPVKVIEELATPLVNLGWRKPDTMRRVAEVARFLGLHDILNRRLDQLSYGQLQRVLLGAAISSDPEVLILDEPMARLDRKTEVMVASLLKRLAEAGKLVVVFEHHLDEIFWLADRVIVLREGTVAADGAPDDVVEELADADLPEELELLAERISIREAVRIVRGLGHLV